MSARKKNNKPLRSVDVPVTQAMLYLVRDELKSHIISHDSRFDSLDKRFEAIDKRFDEVDKRFDSVDKRFDAVDKRFDEVDKRFDAVDKRFDAMDKRFDSLDAKIDSGFLLVAAELKKMQAQMHQQHLLAEEQNSRNIYVMDQYELLKIRGEKLEKRMEDYEKDVQQLIKARKKTPTL